MPYFNWRGINLVGEICYGRRYSLSLDQLDKELFAQEIALLAAHERPARSMLFVHKDRSIAHFFTQLASLLKAGILLPQALQQCAEKESQKVMQEIIAAIAYDLCQGRSLSEACSMHTSLFTPLHVQALYAAQEGSSLLVTVQELARQAEYTVRFRQKLRTLSLVPACAAVFCCLLIGLIFTMVIPRFEPLFASIKGPIPFGTRVLFALSSAVRNFDYTVLVGPWAAVGAGVAILLYRKGYGVGLGLILLNKLPVVRKLYAQSQRAWFYHSLGILIAGGTPLVKALRSLAKGTADPAVCAAITTLCDVVVQGGNLEQALLAGKALFYSDATIFCIQLAEETGELAPMLLKAAQMEHECVERLSERMMTLFQPLLMVLLGIVVMGLIAALYAPLFTLATFI